MQYNGEAVPRAFFGFTYHRRHFEFAISISHAVLSFLISVAYLILFGLRAAKREGRACPLHLYSTTYGLMMYSFDDKRDQKSGC